MEHMDDHLDDETSLTVPKARDGTGQYTRDPATAERDAEAARLRTRGYSYQTIGERLGISKQAAHEAVKRVLKETVQEPGDELRAVSLRRLDDELELLDGLETIVRDTLKKQHVTVSQGHVVYDEEGTGEAVADDSFILSAVDRLQKIAEQRRRCEESRRKLLGMDQPPKLEVSGGITYEIVGIDPRDLT